MCTKTSSLRRKKERDKNSQDDEKHNAERINGRTQAVDCIEQMLDLIGIHGKEKRSRSLYRV